MKSKLLRTVEMLSCKQGMDHAQACFSKALFVAEAQPDMAPESRHEGSSVVLCMVMAVCTKCLLAEA